MPEITSFCEWLQRQPYKHKVVVPGNHDIIMDSAYFRTNWSNWNSSLPDAASAATAAAAAAAAVSNVATVLVDKSAVVDGVRIHGSPWVESYVQSLSSLTHQLKPSPVTPPGKPVSTEATTN